MEFKAQEFIDKTYFLSSHVYVKHFDWDGEKNIELMQEGNIRFEDIVVAIVDNGILDIIEHPNKKRYPN